MSIFIEDPLCSRYKRHRLITSLDFFSIEDSPMDFCSFQAESKPSPGIEYLWFLENECLICFQEIGQLLDHCQTQIHLESANVESRALLIPEQVGEYITGTLHIEGETVSRADLMIRQSPKSNNKTRIYASLKGFSNSWKLRQLTDLSNELALLLVKFTQLTHRQDIQYLPPQNLSILLTDIIESLYKCQGFFLTPKQPNLREIQCKQHVFKPTLPDEILLNIFFSSFHLIVTVFYLSTNPQRYQIPNTRPIVSLSQQESFLNVVLETAGGKEYEVIYQGEGSCQVPTIKHILTTINIVLHHCHALLEKIECFTD